jgi:hypothetical protein
MHHASSCKRLVAEVGYVSSHMEPDVAKPAGNLQPQSDGLSSIIRDGVMVIDSFE